MRIYTYIYIYTYSVTNIFCWRITVCIFWIHLLDICKIELGEHIQNIVYQNDLVVIDM